MVAQYAVIALGGSLGALARYTTVILAQNAWGLRFPWGTLLVNTIGSWIAGFLLGFLVGRFNASETWRLFLFTGFLGAYTTFSSFAAETVLMFRHAQWVKLSINLLANNLCSFCMVFLGTWFARYLITEVLHQP
jgi:CrcB protein